MPRAKMEDGLSDILKSLEPSQSLITVMKAMIKDAWNMRLAQTRERKAEWLRQIKETEKLIEGLVDRLVDTSSQSVVAAYKCRIEKLERQKILLAEKSKNSLPAKGQRESCIELALQFLSSPWEIYKNGSYAARRAVLKLAFLEPVRYSRNERYRTINSAFPFKMLKEITDQYGEMVQRTGERLNSQFDSLSPEELNKLFETLQEWEYHLARLDPKGLRCEDEHFRP